MADGNPPKILNSWKEIASYLGRGVRTVQRWEANLGLPVRRPNQHMRSAVIAVSDELDAWVRNAPRLLRDHGNGNGRDLGNAVGGGAFAAGSLEFRRQLRASLQQTEQLRLRTQQLRAQHQKSLAQLISNVADVERGTKELNARRSLRLASPVVQP